MLVMSTIGLQSVQSSSAFEKVWVGGAGNVSHALALRLARQDLFEARGDDLLLAVL